MPVVKKSSLQLAVRNIARYGDTDIFPFPLENHWLHDDETAVVGLLAELDEEFDDWIDRYPVCSAKCQAGVGYLGFRAGTQIDPIWNAYLLAMVIEAAPEIEAARVGTSRQTVFSYRYAPDPNHSYTLFDRDLGWGAFQRAVLEKAQSHKFVICTDISDFYTRVYHHRLDNALREAVSEQQLAKRLDRLLRDLAAGYSYGLPVGGNASRLLAELLLNRVDRLLLSAGIVFARFVDDYCLFADSREDAQRALVSLSENLLINEGLSLSRAKTRLMTRAEFVRSSPLADPEESESAEEEEGRRFLKMRLAYDPYSPTADDDYEKLSSELSRFDVVGMLAREFRKSRIDEILVRQLVKSIRFLSPPTRERAVRTLLQNLEVLYPVFPTVAIVLKSTLAELSEASRTEVFASLRELIRRGSHIVMVPTNLVFAVRLLSFDPDEETDSLLRSVFESRSDVLVRRDVILAMARRGCSYWISPALKRYDAASPWEKRALIAASYTLGDEGKHWRKRIGDRLSKVDAALLGWLAAKNNGTRWEIPL